MNWVSLKPVVALRKKPSRITTKLRWAMTVPKGPQRKRSAYRPNPCSPASLMVLKLWERKTLSTSLAALSGPAWTRILALRGACVKNVSLMRVRGWKASFHRRGARLTEQARTLVVRSTVIALNQSDVKTEKRPILSRTGVQPPYLECIEATQLAYVDRK